MTLGSTIIYVLCVLCVIAAAVEGNKPPSLSRLVALKLDQAHPPVIGGKSRNQVKHIAQIAKKLFHGAKVKKEEFLRISRSSRSSQAN